MGPAEMGTLTTLLGLPVSGPMSALTWIARQIANAASQELLDPSRIETALLLLERKLEDGEIDEAAFEAEEDRLLQELAEITELRAAEAQAAGDDPAEDSEDREAADDPDAAEPPEPPLTSTTDEVASLTAANLLGEASRPEPVMAGKLPPPTPLPSKPAAEATPEGTSEVSPRDTPEDTPEDTPVGTRQNTPLGHQQDISLAARERSPAEAHVP